MLISTVLEGGRIGQVFLVDGSLQMRLNERYLVPSPIDSIFLYSTTYPI